MNPSTGCERSSRALTPSCTHFCRTSSARIMLLPKLYGTFNPIWTPATFELGFAAAACGQKRAAGTAASASLPNSRLVYDMAPRFTCVTARTPDSTRISRMVAGEIAPGAQPGPAGRRVVLRGVVQYQHPVEHLPLVRRRELTVASVREHADGGRPAVPRIEPPCADAAAGNDGHMNRERAANRRVDHGVRSIGIARRDEAIPTGAGNA